MPFWIASPPSCTSEVEVERGGVLETKSWPKKVPVGAVNKPEEVAKVKFREDETWVAVSKRAIPLGVPLAAAAVEVMYLLPVASSKLGIWAEPKIVRFVPEPFKKLRVVAEAVVRRRVVPVPLVKVMFVEETLVEETFVAARFVLETLWRLDWPETVR